MGGGVVGSEQGRVNSFAGLISIAVARPIRTKSDAAKLDGEIFSSQIRRSLFSFDRSTGSRLTTQPVPCYKCLNCNA